MENETIEELWNTNGRDFIVENHPEVIAWRKREKKALYTREYYKTPKGKEIQLKWRKLKKKNSKSKSVNIQCQNCGNFFVRWYDRTKTHFKRHFCSRKCYGLANGEIQKGELSKCWTGGRVATGKRNYARRKNYDFQPINEYFKGSEGHHIDRQHVIFIPKKLHESVWHSLNQPETMAKINTKVFCWLLGKGGS